MSAQTAAWNRGDIDGFMNGYARSNAIEFISGDKLTRGWQTVRDRYKKKFRQPRENGHAQLFRAKNYALEQRRCAGPGMLEAGPEE